MLNPPGRYTGKGQYTICALAQENLVDVRFGSKADICSAKSHVRFTPNSDRESEISAKGHVCFTPESGRVRCS
jgi:hypothetical protein